jgi:uncharacterized protein (TIGR03435 family)
MALILFAYDATYREVVGLPDWEMTSLYAVNASAGDDYPPLSPDENRERERLMMRELLKDRFHLQLHTEARQVKVLEMSVEPGPLRMKQVPAPVTPEAVGLSMGNAEGHIIGKRTMAKFAKDVGLLIRQPVIDKTNLPGYYDLNFSYHAPTTGAPPQPGLGPDGIALFFTAMKDQFGLRFSGATGAVTYWVVDHIEPPSAN